jgi:hypothetical protein
MEDWNGAQWLVLFFFGIRRVLGAARAMGRIHVQAAQLTPWSEWAVSLLKDAVVLAILVWGGFF